jgi:hypothetical protein
MIKINRYFFITETGGVQSGVRVEAEETVDDLNKQSPARSIVDLLVYEIPTLMISIMIQGRRRILERVLCKTYKATFTRPASSAVLLELFTNLKFRDN